MRYNGGLQALYISSTVTNYQHVAQMVTGMIERGIVTRNCKKSLLRSQDILQKAAIHDATLKNIRYSLAVTCRWQNKC
jgi:hypothetical protein